MKNILLTDKQKDLRRKARKQAYAAMRAMRIAKSYADGARMAMDARYMTRICEDYTQQVESLACKSASFAFLAHPELREVSR